MKQETKEGIITGLVIGLVLSCFLGLFIYMAITHEQANYQDTYCEKIHGYKSGVTAYYLDDNGLCCYKQPEYEKDNKMIKMELKEVCISG